jgi:hypothetical protein
MWFMFDDILKIANLYDEGLAQVKRRRELWLEKYVIIRDHLKEMAQYLNEHANYKQGFFVDTLHAFNEDIKGTSSRMPSIAFRSGAMPMLVTFRNNMGEKKAYSEEGFSISFTPTITGQVVVLLQPHVSDLDKDPPDYNTVAVIDDPGSITTGIIDEIIERGMESAFYSSFTGMGQVPDDETEGQNKPVTRNPIGFKRYDTTEKLS